MTMVQPIIETCDSKMKAARAAFANLARMNIFNTLQFISDKIGIKGRFSEDAICDMAIFSLEKNIKNSELRDDAFRLLSAHFPFVKEMYEQEKALSKRADTHQEDFPPLDYDIFVSILKKTIDVLVYYRDLSTHHAFRDNRTYNKEYTEKEERVAWYLDFCLTVAIRKIKERFEYEFKTNTYKNCLDFLNGRTNVKKYENEKGESSHKVVLNHKHKFSLSKEQREKRSNIVKLSELGKIFLISLFIQKQYSSELLDKSGKLEIIQDAEKDHLKIKVNSFLKDIFSALRIRLARERVNTEIKIDQIGMDMIGELKKCPKELFDIIPLKGQELFRGIDGRTGETILHRRMTDRFPTLALSYIDHSKLFTRARFAVNVGNFRYVFKREKRYIDGNTEPRILQKDLNGFGRIQEIEDIRTSCSENSPWPYQNLIKEWESTPRKDAKCCPYIQDTYTRYLFNGNHIGICFGTKTDSYPEEYQSKLKHDNNIIWHLPQIKSEGADEQIVQINCLEPDCWINIFDIPAMVFHAFLTKDEKAYQMSPTEKIILDCIVRYRRLFKDIATGELDKIDNEKVETSIKEQYGINFKDIPSGLQAYLKKDKYDGPKRLKERVLRMLKGEHEQEIKNNGNSEKFNILSNEDANSFLERLGKGCGTWSSKGLIEESMDWLNNFENELNAVKDYKNNKAGKSDFVEIKIGKIMGKMLKDIVRLQKYSTTTDETTGKKKGNKLTGANYAKLQKLLSTYPFNNSDELKEIFRTYGILETHPFLEKVFGDEEAKISPPTDPISLYSNYLELRYGFFCGILDDLNKNKEFDSSYFMRTDRNKYKQDYLRNLPQEYYKKETEIERFIPTYLPSGLFEEPIRAKLDGLKNQELSQALSKGDRIDKKTGKTLKANTTYMIQKYFEIIKKDAPQSYYNFERTYSFHEYVDKKRDDVKTKALSQLKEQSNFQKAVEEALKREPLKKKKPKHNTKNEKNQKPPIPFSMQTLKRKWIEMCNNELLIRRLKIQDILLFMIGSSIVFPSDKQTQIQEDGFYLKNILRGNDNIDILSLPIDISTTVVIKNKKYEITQKGVKVRDYTEIFSLLRDSRTRILLGLLPDTKIDYELLREELKRYDIQRPNLFLYVLNFEKERYKKFETQLSENKIDFKRLLSLDSVLTEEVKEKLKAIRNSFCHNSYPDKDKAQYSPQLIEGKPEKGPADTLVKEANKLMTTN